MEIPQVENGSLDEETVKDQLMEAIQDEANHRAEQDRLDSEMSQEQNDPKYNQTDDQQSGGFGQY